MLVSTKTAGYVLTSLQKYLVSVPTNAAGNSHKVSLKTSSGFTLTNVEVTDLSAFWPVTPSPSPPAPDMTVRS